MFAFVVTNAKAGEVVSGQGFRNYRVGDYSNWLQQQVSSTSNWAAISSCIAASSVCPTLAAKYATQAALLSSNLTPAEVGTHRGMLPQDCSEYTHFHRFNLIVYVRFGTASVRRSQFFRLLSFVFLNRSAPNKIT